MGVFNAMLDRTRSRLDIPALRTLSGARRRPGKYGTAPSPRAGVALETPARDLTVFKVHSGPGFNRQVTSTSIHMANPGPARVPRGHAPL